MPHLRPRQRPRPSLLSSGLGTPQSFATDYTTGLGERPHELVAMFGLESLHLFHRLLDPAHCVPQVLQSGVQERLSVYRQQMRIAGVAFEGSPAGPEDCGGPKQTPRCCNKSSYV